MGLCQSHVETPDPEAIRQLGDLLSAARRAVVFTGAGMSTESGLPDFRSAGGLWKQNRRFEALASTHALEHEYGEFLEFYRYRLRALASFAPNAGHSVLARWQEQGRIQRVITQNVDGYHEAAGNREVLCLHGTLARIRCQRCASAADAVTFLEVTPPLCARCGGKLRPGVVLFGEPLDEAVLEEACRVSSDADLFIVLGSSLLVSPANALPRLALSQNGAKLVIVNREATPLSSLAALDVRAGIGDTLAAVERALR